MIAAFRHRWGLDRPLPEQYGIYLWNLARGDMGVSISTRQPVMVDLKQHLPATIELATAAMLTSLLVSIPLGMLSAVRRDTMLDQLARIGSLIGVSTPIFWLGIVAIVLFYAYLGWAPSPGRLSMEIPPPPPVTGFVVVDAVLARRLDAAADALSPRSCSRRTASGWSPE